MTAHKTQEGLVYYFRPGKGMALVFIHGFCEDHRMWKETLALFPDNPILLIDLPGFGLSDRMEGWQIVDVSEKFLTLISSLNLSSFIVFGHSLGGYIALQMLGNTKKIKGLGLIHSHPYADSEEKKENRLKGKTFVEQYGTAPYVKEIIHSLFTPEFAKSKPAILEKLVQHVLSVSTEGIIDALDAMRLRTDTSSILENAECPVLFMIGEKDQAIPQAFSLKQTSLPAVGSVHIYHDVAHMAMWESPQEYSRDMRHFVEFCSS